MTHGSNCVIVGRRRQGKSTLAVWLAQRKRFIIVFDPNAQFNMRVAIVVYGADGFVVWLADALEGEAASNIMIFRPDPEKIEAEFQSFCNALWCLGNYAIILDEASCVQRFSAVNPKLERIVRQAPRDGPYAVSLIQTSHRMVDYHGVCRSLATDFFLFQTTLARDLDLIEEQFGPEVRNEVQTLGQFQLIHCWTADDGRFQWKRWNNPEVWYVRLNDVQLQQQDAARSSASRSSNSGGASSSNSSGASSSGERSPVAA